MFQGFNINLHCTDNKEAYASDAVGFFDIQSVVASDYEQITVTIGAANNATAYEYFYRVVGGGGWISDGQQAGLSRIITGLIETTNYEFYVTAIGPSDTRDSSVQQQTTLTNPIPTTPTFTIDSVGTSVLAVSWVSDNVNTDNYRVEYKLTSSGTWTTFATLGNTASGDTITGLSGYEDYDARVVAVNAYNEVNSNIATDQTTPTAVQSLTSSIPATDTIRITWNAPTSGAGSYRVQRNLNGGGITTVSSSQAGLTYDFTGIVRGSDTLDAYVFGLSDDLLQGLQALLSGLSIPNAPTAATSLVASNIQQTSFQLSFTAGTDVEDYDIQTSPAGAGTWTTRVTGTTQTSNVVVSGLTLSTDYDVRVISNGFVGSETAISTDIPVTTAGILFARPTSDVANGGFVTAPLFSKVNDQSDTTFINSDNGNTSCEFGFGSFAATNPILKWNSRDAGGNIDFSAVIEIKVNGNVVQTSPTYASFGTLSTSSLSYTGSWGAGDTVTVTFSRSGGGNPNSRRTYDVTEVWIEY